MSEGALWNAPFYIAGGITLLLMLFWDRIVAWLERLEHASLERSSVRTRRAVVRVEPSWPVGENPARSIDSCEERTGKG